MNVVWAFLFLLCFGAAGWVLFYCPVQLARWTKSKGIYHPFLELTHSRSGLFQVRALGLIFFLASIFTAALIAYFTWGSRQT